MDKPLIELDLDSLENVTGGATFDIFDPECKDSVGLSKPCPHCGKECKRKA